MDVEPGDVVGAAPVVGAAGVADAAAEVEADVAPEAIDVDAPGWLSAAEAVCSGGVLGAGAGVGRGVTGRRERFATLWDSPVGASARVARGRRAKAYGSSGFRAGLCGC